MVILLESCIVDANSTDCVQCLHNGPSDLNEKFKQNTMFLNIDSKNMITNSNINCHIGFVM